MPTPIEFKAPFYPGAFYHIVCKSIDGILLFIDPTEYRVFKDRLITFTGMCFEYWSYCHLPNHTHHIVKAREARELALFIEQLPGEERTLSMTSFLQDTADARLFDAVVLRQMNRFLVSFSNFINNRRKRKGGTFQKPFRRREIENESHLQQAVIYTNANAQKHNMVDDFKDYPYSSYTETLDGSSFILETEKVLDFFGGKENFIKTHEDQVDRYYRSSWPASKLE